MNTEIPSALNSILKNKKEKIVFFQNSDLTFDRKFGKSFLVLTENKLLSTNENFDIINEFPLEKIAAIKNDELVGGGRVCIESDGMMHYIIYYTNHYAPYFVDATNYINQYLTKKEIIPASQNYASICQKCKSPLPDRDAHCPKCVPKFKILLRIFELARPYKNNAIFLMIVTALGVLFQVIPPYITKKIVDDVIGKEKHELIWLYIGAMAATGILYLIVRIINLRLTTFISARIVSDLRCKLHESLQYMKLQYFSRREPGELVGRITHDAEELQHFLVEGMPFLFVNTISFVVVAAILIKMNWTLALFVFLPVPALVIGSSWFWKRLNPLFLRQGTIIGHLHSVLNESIHGLRAIKVCSKEKHRIKLFNSVTDELAKTQVQTQRVLGSFNEVMFWIMSLGVTLVWFFAVKQITSKTHEMTIGDLLAFVGYIWLFYGPLQWYSVILNWMTQAFSGAERIFEVIDAASEKQNASHIISLGNIEGKIEFQNVRFSYEQGKEIIKGLSFKIAQGETIGLVGRSGAGKSTLINLLTRFYSPDSGEILIDDVSIKKINLIQLRKNIGIVMQEPFIFNASIAENIAYGIDNVSFKEIIQAAKAAYAHDFIIRKSEGYDTLIGDSGIRLSGGEKQRIAIARAILQNPPILILDEATSAVDTTTEQHIQNAISELIKGRTTIAIAHRLSTLRNANRLIVIDNGKIAECGSHEELMSFEGIYYDMVKSYTRMNTLQSVVWGGE